MFRSTIIKQIIFLAITVTFLFLVLPFARGMYEFVVSLWTWRPATVIGGAMVIVPVLTAIPIHYFLNVARTTGGGVIKVSSFADYFSHGLLNLVIKWTFSGSILTGVFILLFGFEIR